MTTPMATFPGAPRMRKTFSVGIIGAGPGGLALGIFLRRAGFDDFTIFDREAGVGGTWRINTYPGLACDVKSHLYSYSFDLNAGWSRLWSGQEEILEYFERCAQRYRLHDKLRLNTEIVSAQWFSEERQWRLVTSTGEEHRFDIVVSAVGLFTQQRLHLRQRQDVRLDDAAAGRRLRERPSQVGGETLETRAGIGHIGSAQTDIGQCFGSRRHGRVEPAGFAQGDQFVEQRVVRTPVGERFAKDHPKFLVAGIGHGALDDARGSAGKGQPSGTIIA